MKHLLLAIFISCAAGRVALHGGDIVGTVHAKGKEGADVATPDGKYDSRKFKFLNLEKVDYSQMHDFVVFIDQPLTNQPPPPPKPVEVVTQRQINQKDAVFSPHVLPIAVGTTVNWPNNDEIYHNVFSYSEARPFDLGLYSSKDKEVKKVTFEKPGQVDAFCSIHSQMHCIILVMQNPFFGKTDAKNYYSISNVPAGTYKLRAWHERMPTELKEVVVPEKGSVRVDFELGIKGLPKF